MPELLTSEMRSWIGRSAPPQRIEVTRRDIVKYAIATEQRLDRYRTGDAAPPMFLFGASSPLTSLDELGPDGLRRDALLPDLPLKRVMAGGIKQRHHRSIRPGDVLLIEREITDIYEKEGSQGPLIFIVYTITITTEDGELVMQETQTRINR
jgi:3-methylfumaryl-CoA hydratase